MFYHHFVLLIPVGKYLQNVILFPTRSSKGVVVYTLSLRLYSLEATGLWGVASQAMSLAMTVVFVSLDNNHAAAAAAADEDDNNNTASNNKGDDDTTTLLLLYLTIVSIISSRIGLWVFDISVTQLQQQEIPETYRCRIGGVQEALNAFCSMISFGLGLLFTHPNPTDFIYISTGGFLSVALALSVFFFGIYLPRRRRRRRRRRQRNVVL